MSIVEVSESPFASMLGTNHIPLEDEISAIQKHLVTLVAATTTFDKGIGKLQKELKTLQEARDALCHAIELHKALISPLRRYPDILQEIFHHCLPTAHDATMNPWDAPLLLTHICRDWRNLALSTPSFWSTILICNRRTRQLKVLPREDGLSGECAHQRQRTSAKTCAAGVQEWL